MVGKIGLVFLKTKNSTIEICLKDYANSKWNNNEEQKLVQRAVFNQRGY